jgi:hypothetical protein
MQHNWKWFLFTLAFLSFLCAIVCVGYGYFLYRQRSTQEKAVLEEIGKRSGLPPNWLSIREFVYCDLVTPGTLKEEVDQGLALIGEYRLPNQDMPVEGWFQQQIDFTDPFIYYNLSPLIIQYNEELKVEIAGAGEFNHGPRASCEIVGSKITTIPSSQK